MTIILPQEHSDHFKAELQNFTAREIMDSMKQLILAHNVDVSIDVSGVKKYTFRRQHISQVLFLLSDTLYELETQERSL